MTSFCSVSFCYNLDEMLVYDINQPIVKLVSLCVVSLRVVEHIDDVK